MKAKRIVAFLVSLIVCVTALALPASAEGFTYTWDPEGGGPHCKSLLMMNVDTNSIVYSLNPDEKLPMASITKIMTYIVAYETISNMENTVITVPESVLTELEGTYSSVAELNVGEQLTGLQLLYLLMVPSGNDAALTLAKYVDSLYESGQLVPKSTEAPAAGGASEGQAQPEAQSEPTASQTAQVGPEPFVGMAADKTEPQVMPMAETGDAAATDGEGEEAPVETAPPVPESTSYFVKLMNEKAKELGCENTHFMNPHGLYDENHYSTARDLMKIASYATTLPNFTEIVSTPAYLLAATNMYDETRTYDSTNRMLSDYVGEDGMSYFYQYATGMKTGSLSQAGYCIAASAQAYGYTYIVVALGAPMEDADGNSLPHGEMLDAAELFRWALTTLGKKTVVAQGDLVQTVGLKYAWRKDTLQVVAGENASAMLPNSVEASSITVEYSLPESVEAPVKKGEPLGTATLKYADEVVGTIPLVAGESVEKSSLIQTVTEGQQVVTSPWFLIIIGAIALLVLIYVVLAVLYRKKQKKLKRVKRFRDM